MKYKKLNKNGPELSVLGLGSWQMGGPWRYGWGRVENNTSIDIIHQALDLGINWIDTAAVYGLGFAERILARALKKKRHNVFIATKCGLVWEKSIAKRPHNLTPANIRREVDLSLLRLSTDYIDIYQMHAPDPETPVEDSWNEMVKLKQEGKIRWIGLSNFNKDLLSRCLDIFNVDSMQMPYNLLDRKIEENIIPYCVEKDIGLLAYSPLASGLLTGKFDITALAKDDWRRKDNRFKGPQLFATNSKVEKLKQIAQDCGCSASQLALAWNLSKEDVSSTIIGVRSIKQLAENVKSLDLELTNKVQSDMNTIF